MIFFGRHQLGCFWATFVDDIILLVSMTLADISRKIAMTNIARKIALVDVDQKNITD